MIKITADSIINGDGKFYDNSTLIFDEKSGVIIDFIKNEILPDSIKYNGVIIPGMINSHCHSELSHLHNKIEMHTGLSQFVKQVTAQRKENESEIKNSCNRAIAEMKRNGTVAVGDICNTSVSENLFEKNQIKAHRFCEVFAFHPDTAEKAFEKGKELKNYFLSKGLPSSITFHAPYSLSKKLAGLISDYEYSKNSIFTIHNQESKEEDEFFKHGTGKITERFKEWNIDYSFFKPTEKSSLRSVLSFLPPKIKLMLVHNTFTELEDIEFAESFYKNIYWCFCPKANRYIENTLPNFQLWNCDANNLLLGTDSLASNNSLNLIDEMRVIQERYPKIAFHQMVKWVCLNAARFFNFEDTLGSFEKGKKPGILNIKNANTQYVKEDFCILSIA